MELSVCCLGTGRGATAVWEGEPSSAVALLFDGRPVLLVDVGFGVVRACRHWLGTVPDTILVTHNHSDHAAELPVVLPLAAAAGRRPRVIAAPQYTRTVKGAHSRSCAAWGARTSEYTSTPYLRQSAELEISTSLGYSVRSLFW